MVTVTLTYFSLQFGFNHHSSAALNDNTMSTLAQDYLKQNEAEKATKLLLDYTNNHTDAPLSHFILGNIAFRKRR